MPRCLEFLRLEGGKSSMNVACDICNSPNIREEILFCRGMRHGVYAKWREIYRRCEDCGATKRYSEEGW